MYLVIPVLIILLFVLIVFAIREGLDCLPKEFDPRRPDPGYENTPTGLGVYLNGKLINCNPNFAKLPASQVGVNPFADCMVKFNDEKN